MNCDEKNIEFIELRWGSVNYDVVTETITGKSRNGVPFIISGVNGDSLNSWILGKVMIQDAFPNMSSDDRELLISGTTRDEWRAMFSEDGSDDDLADLFSDSDLIVTEMMIVKEFGPYGGEQ